MHVRSIFLSQRLISTSSHRRLRCLVTPRRVIRGKRLQIRSKATALTEELPSQLSDFQRVKVLSEALPYLQKFAKKTIVIKYGGAAMKDEELKMGVIKDLVLLSCVGVRPILVHGGGPEINSWLNKLGIEPVFRNGRRVTDSEAKLHLHDYFLMLLNGVEDTMEVVEMVLGGRVNKSLVSLIQQMGGRAVGVSGRDGDLIIGRPMLNGELGFTGEIVKINKQLLYHVVENDYIPVVATIAANEQGGSLNVNADTVAGEIAGALEAEKLILMTDVPGVLKDPEDRKSIIRTLDVESTKAQIRDGVISGGMIPKIECCMRCLEHGVPAAHIIDGRQKHSLLMELLTDEGVGTMITNK